MLLLIHGNKNDSIQALNSNTSYVAINQSSINALGSTEKNSNTSYVAINLTSQPSILSKTWIQIHRMLLLIENG